MRHALGRMIVGAQERRWEALSEDDNTVEGNLLLSESDLKDGMQRDRVGVLKDE